MAETELQQSARRMTNIEAWHAHGSRHAEIETAVVAFEADLRASLGDAITPGQSALVECAAALLGGILLVRRRLLKGRRGRYGNLLEQLPLLSGALTRVLRTLGASKGAGNDPNLPPADATPEELRAWSRGYVERVAVSGDGSAATP